MLNLSRLPLFLSVSVVPTAVQAAIISRLGGYGSLLPSLLASIPAPRPISEPKPALPFLYSRL